MAIDIDHNDEFDEVAVLVDYHFDQTHWRGSIPGRLDEPIVGTSLAEVADRVLRLVDSDLDDYEGNLVLEQTIHVSPLVATALRVAGAVQSAWWDFQEECQQQFARALAHLSALGLGERDLEMLFAVPTRPPVADLVRRGNHLFATEDARGLRDPADTRREELIRDVVHSLTYVEMYDTRYFNEFDLAGDDDAHPPRHWG